MPAMPAGASSQVADERSIGDQLTTVAGLLAVEGERVVGRWLDRIGQQLDRVSRVEVDEFGYDAGFTTKVALPAARALATTWFRTTVQGAGALPEGPALLVANHAGTLPLDGAMIQLAVHDADPANRVLRMLAADRMFATPVLGDLTRRMGATMACAEDVDRLLAGGHLVLVFPEGFKGIGKPYRDRYRLQRFGRGGFVAAALRAQVPIVPVSVVGSEEIYPKLGELPWLAELLSVPYFPITPTWPWLGPLGMVPLPSRWVIDFGAPIPTAGYADDPSIVLELTDAVRQRIQQRLHELLAPRGPAF